MAFMEYTIITFQHKRPDFIELQLNSIKKWVKGTFEYIVYDNAIDNPTRKECERLGVGYRPLPRPKRNQVDPSTAHARALTSAVQDTINNTNKVIFMDFDMFFIAPIPDLNTYDMAYVEQTRDNGLFYPWAGFVMMNMGNLPNHEEMAWLPYNGGDTGAQMHPYLVKYNPKVKKLHMWTVVDETNFSFDGKDIPKPHGREKDMIAMFDKKFSPPNFDVICEDGADFKDSFILHHKSVSWWCADVENYNNLKFAAFKEFLQERNK